MEYLTAGKEDVLGILELYKQLNQNNDNFTINEINKTWDKIENKKLRSARNNSRLH
jgi:hypothetical protein